MRVLCTDLKGPFPVSIAGYTGTRNSSRTSTRVSGSSSSSKQRQKLARRPNDASRASMARSALQSTATARRRKRTPEVYSYRMAPFDTVNGRRIQLGSAIVQGRMHATTCDPAGSRDLSSITKSLIHVSRTVIFSPRPARKSRLGAHIAPHNSRSEAEKVRGARLYIIYNVTPDSPGASGHRWK